MKELALSGRSRLLGIGDVTCDLEGSIEWLRHFTTPSQPFWVYNTVTQEVKHEIVCPDENWILYDSLDFLPSELSYDSSKLFKILDLF
jgi:alpha-aminoadipic semialdehyde synthase